MKKDSGERILEFANWFNLNLLIAFAPFIVINLMNCIIGYKIGLEDIIFDYAGLAYSTSVVLLSCLLDSIKRNGKLVVAQLLLQFAILSFVISMLIYTILNVCFGFIHDFYYRNNMEKAYYAMILKMFIVLTIIMVVNILVIIIIKVKEYCFKDKEVEKP